MKEDFLRTFANVPLGLRREIIYVDQEYGTMSWLVLNLEVKQGTEVAQRALTFLKAAGII